MNSDPGTVTRFLRAWQGGDRSALDRLIPLMHGELRHVAENAMLRERRGHSLQPTALVAEVYLKLVNQRYAHWKDRAHFLAIAAQMMRRILVDHAREKGAVKRGGRVETVVFDEQIDGVDEKALDLVRLDDAMNDLEALDDRQARVVELRFFGGLTIEETALVLNISTATVKREWRTARVWLFQHLEGD